MISPEIRNATFLDILFENRNKEYGAYTLRKFYNQRLGAALATGLCGAFALLLLAMRQHGADVEAPDYNVLPDVVLQNYIIPDAPKPPELPRAQPQPPAPRVAQQQFDGIRITPNPVAVTDVPTYEDLENVVISSTTTEGMPAGATPTAPAPATGNGDASAPAAQAAPAPSYMEPQFPGGASAWSAFLSRHLQAPAELETGEKKTVLIRFKVSDDGAVTGFEVVQSGGDAFDAEVIRVLKKMPKWKPALRNGQPVAVPFTQPVTFVAMEE